MAKPDRRGFAAPPPPPPSRGRASAGARPRPRQQAPVDEDDDDEPPRRGGLIGALFVLLIVVFGAVVWNAYGGGGDIRANLARVTAPSPYKTPGPDANAESPASIEGKLRDPAPVAEPELQPAPEEPSETASAPAAPIGPAPPPRVVRDGPFVAQIAALQQERSIDPLWRRLSERAPDLFAGAQLDVQQADLGPRGVSHRVRVGYFPDRENAARFCDRLKAMGQDCLVAAR